MMKLLVVFFCREELHFVWGLWLLLGQASFTLTMPVIMVSNFLSTFLIVTFMFYILGNVMKKTREGVWVVAISGTTQNPTQILHR